MKAPRTNIPDAVRAPQTQASDPATSVFVAANAGSGKTHVLVNRVIRLLLDGVPPEKILCITFTKAAAANMSERVFGKLGSWVAIDDVGLETALRDMGVPRIDAKVRRRARELFACALETPGGLKVQTIHALCTRLLQQFPFEAQVPARFAVLDERDQTDMLHRANMTVLLDAAANPESAIGRALSTAIGAAADVTFQDVLREACLGRGKYIVWIDEHGGIEKAMAQVVQTLGVDSAMTMAQVEDSIVNGPHLPVEQWGDVAKRLAKGKDTDRKNAELLREAHAQSGAPRVATYLSIFLTQDKKFRAKFVTGAIVDSDAALAQLIDAEALRLTSLIESYRAVQSRDRTQALLTIASAVTTHYQDEKQARGLLDYDDLIEKTLDMLTKFSSSWVHYKLDRGVDHVLIDEAQDTSPAQWDIVFKLIGEFASGAGARDAKRTLFAVGDEKQSIFSFQGAEPKQFDERRREIEKLFDDAKLAFSQVSLKHSFRSGKAILQAVDRVFRPEEIYKSIHSEANGYPIHESLESAAPSMIDLWPLEETQKTEDMEGWRAAVDSIPTTAPEVRLAHRVQAEIKRLIAEGATTGSGTSTRRISYGDCLVLVRRRGRAFDAVLQALKKAGVPVAGADRLKLIEHIAVIDLMNLADAILMPDDDLALAVALKSPLFGLDDNDLMSFAPERGRKSLRGALDHASNPKLAEASKLLKDFDTQAFRKAPFAFFAGMLGGKLNGRAKILSRLGPEANDALDEFLELALAYERRAPASLQGFMAWLRASDTDIKRDMELGRDEVRVMTVHGAKGLEASVVFLVDTTIPPTDGFRINLARLPRGNAPAHASPIAVWAGRKADDPQAVADARETMRAEANDEYRRLLYVAMTRAADRLIVGGSMPGNRKTLSPQSSWYELIRAALTAEDSGLAKRELEFDHGKVTRFTKPQDTSGLLPLTQSVNVMPDDGPLPSWLRTPAPPRARTQLQLRPSGALDDNAHSERSNDSGGSRRDALRKGVLIHRLLQSLPNIDASKRGSAAMAFLARNAQELATQHSGLTKQVLGLIADPRFSEVFANGSRAEAPIAGRLTQKDGTTALVAGQIDRLAIGPNTIWIADYKTNRSPPQTADQAPAAYVGQLALYRAVLAKLYPQHAIRCVLLWTETAEIMEIPAPALDAALERIITT